MIVEIMRCKKGGKPYIQSFKYEGELHRSISYVLDTINYSDDIYDIEGNRCGRIIWECSCNQKQCGACAMVINGEPALACATFVDELKLKHDTLRLEPLSKFKVIEDLKVDRHVIQESMLDMNMWVNEAKVIDEKNYDYCYECAKCLKCGLCLEVCPNYVGGNFKGPVAVAEGYLALCQGKDIKTSIKKDFLNGCSKSGACMEVCPVHMETLSMIAKLASNRLV